MSAVFGDTSFYFALLNPADAWHKAAVVLSRELDRPVVTSKFVLLELGNALARTTSRQTFVELVEALRADSQISIVPSSARLWADGFELFGRRNDKHWSMIDCSSFAIMKDRGLSDILTSDRHFEQAGFHMLLR